MRYGSVCSGVEAASVAWHPLGWEGAFVSEVEKFPCAVLAHHWPKIPNLGDLTAPDFIDRAKACGPIDLLVGGTPCQAFSVAGLRKSLGDARGNLTLRYLEVLHGLAPRIFVWENVPGVLNTKDNAFGCFLAGAVGGDAPLLPFDPRAGWPSAGVATGPRYGVAWRVLDAQFFGVPQRRRRVFAVGYLGDWRRAASVLFEPNCVLGNPASGEEAREGAAGQAQGGAGYGGITHTLRAEHDASEDGTGRGAPIVIDRAAFNQGENAQYEARIEETETMPSLVGRGPHAIIAAHETGQGYWQEGDKAGTLRAEGENRPSRPSNIVAFFCKDSGQEAMEDIAPTLRAGNHDASHPNAGIPPAVCYDMRGNGSGSVVPTLTGDHASRPTDYTPVIFKPSHFTRGEDGAPSEVSPPLSAEADKGDQDPLVFESRFARNGRGAPEPVCPPLKAQSGETGKGDAAPIVKLGMAVRRLTPRECERLQGFPDDYTAIPWKRKLAPDGQRYRAMGNSMAVPVMRWLGERITQVDKYLKRDQK